MASETSLIATLCIFLLAGVSSNTAKRFCEHIINSESVSCYILQELNTIPSNLSNQLPTLMYSLDLSDFNNIKIENNMFDILQRDEVIRKNRSCYVVFQKLYLKNCNLTKILAAAFNGLRELTVLDLSTNSFNEIPKDALSVLPKLKWLDLSDNPIKYIKGDSFPLVPELKTLHLENCELTKINNGAFLPLVRLQTLFLDSNYLNRLSVDTFQGLNHLGNVSIFNNPLLCDCYYTELMEYPDLEVEKSVDSKCPYTTCMSVNVSAIMSITNDSNTNRTETETTVSEIIGVKCLIRTELPLRNVSVLWYFNSEVDHVPYNSPDLFITETRLNNYEILNTIQLKSHKFGDSICTNCSYHCAAETIADHVEDTCFVK